MPEGPALEMSYLSADDELELQSLLKQLLQSINDRISNAPSTECAEEILLHLEETDKNFHKSDSHIYLFIYKVCFILCGFLLSFFYSSYEFVKYLRQYVETSLGTVVEEDIKNLTRGDGQHVVGLGHDTVVHSVTRKTRESAE